MADQFTRINQLLTALALDVQVIEGGMLGYEAAEQMLRTIHAARTELDALALAAEQRVALAA